MRGIQGNERIKAMKEFRPDPKPEPKEKKKRKRIPYVSESRKLDNKLYKQARKEYLANHPYCERCLELNTYFFGRSNQIHHRKGRVGSLLFNNKFFMACCDDCHKYIEANPIEAKEKGWSISRLSL